jgi:hypothetical protein
MDDSRAFKTVEDDRPIKPGKKANAVMDEDRDYIQESAHKRSSKDVKNSFDD